MPERGGGEMDVVVCRGEAENMTLQITMGEACLLSGEVPDTEVRLLSRLGGWIAGRRMITL